MRNKDSYNAYVCAGTCVENVRTYQGFHQPYWKNNLRWKYLLDGKLTSNLFPHISAVIKFSKRAIKKISPRLHGTEAKKMREKPFNQYFIDQFAGFCYTLIKKSLSTEVYESTFTLQLHTILLRIPPLRGTATESPTKLTKTFEFKTPVNTDSIIYGISNPFFCPKITRVVHQLRMFTFHENLIFPIFVSPPLSFWLDFRFLCCVSIKI